MNAIAVSVQILTQCVHDWLLASFGWLFHALGIDIDMYGASCRYCKQPDGPDYGATLAGAVIALTFIAIPSAIVRLFSGSIMSDMEDFDEFGFVNLTALYLLYLGAMPAMFVFVVCHIGEFSQWQRVLLFIISMPGIWTAIIPFPGLVNVFGAIYLYLQPLFLVKDVTTRLYTLVRRSMVGANQSTG